MKKKSTQSRSAAVKAWHEDPAELAKRRRQAGLTQAEVAKTVGRSRSLIRDLELGKIKLRGKLANDVWNAIADATPSKPGRNAIAEKIFGRLPWPTKNEVVKVDLADLVANARRQARLEKKNAQLDTELAHLTLKFRQLEEVVRELRERCDKVTAAHGAKMLEELEAEASPQEHHG